MRRLFLTGLTNFTSDVFVSVFDTFAFVRLGRSFCSDFGCKLTYFFFINTLNDDFVCTLNNGFDACGIFHFYRVRITHILLQLILTIFT